MPITSPTRGLHVSPPVERPEPLSKNIKKRLGRTRKGADTVSRLTHARERAAKFRRALSRKGVVAGTVYTGSTGTYARGY